jgi:hypothetical protein
MLQIKTSPVKWRTSNNNNNENRKTRVLGCDKCRQSEQMRLSALMNAASVSENESFSFTKREHCLQHRNNSIRGVQRANTASIIEEEFVADIDTNIRSDSVRLELRTSEQVQTLTKSRSLPKFASQQDCAKSYVSPEELPTPAEMSQMNRQRLGSQTERFSFVSIHAINSGATQDSDDDDGRISSNTCLSFQHKPTSASSTSSESSHSSASSTFTESDGVDTRIGTHVWTWGGNTLGQCGLSYTSQAR